MKYKYRGFDVASSQRTEGEINALSEQDAVRLLAEQRIEVFAIASSDDAGKTGRRVKRSDLVLPLQELATLTASGVALIDAVKALAQNKEHLQLARGFQAITSHIEGGGNFSDAILQSKLPFPDYVSHLVNAGELGGDLAGALESAAAQMSYEQSVNSDIRSALTYPIVLVASGVAAMLIIFFAVVPKFSHMLDGGKELPFLAYAVLSAGRFANESPWLIVGSIVLVMLTLFAVFTNPKVRTLAKDFALTLPVIGPWLEEQDAARWSSLTAAMLSARVNLLRALELAAQSCDFTRRRERAIAMLGDIESGATFAEALERARLVPPTSLNLVTVGDKTGQLAEMLTAVASLHDKSCKRRMQQVLTLMEPIAILVVGVLIGIMILGIVLAITASTDIAI